MDTTRTGTWRALRAALLLAVVLAAGVGLGVALDRAWLRPAPPAAPTRPEIAGRWVRVDKGTPMVFNPDGTFEDVGVFTISEGGKVLSRDERPDVGQWRWADAERIELVSRFWGRMQVRVVLSGDSLKLLGDGGGVWEYRR